MKRNPFKGLKLPTNRLLILSDGKPGHVNQSIAFARHLGCEYDICPTGFHNRVAKVFSYLADRCRLQLASLFHCGAISGEYKGIVSAGSETYYANRVLAKRLGIKSIAIMLPQGYRYDFDLIVAQQHDDPPQRENIVSIPINLTYVEPQGLVKPEPGCRYVSIVIGGHSKHVQLEPKLLAEQLEKIFALFPLHKFWLTTSRRTPAEIEGVLKGFSFARAVFYSDEQINPIPDFLQHSEYVFLTADSTSMISEAVSFGVGCVEVLPLAERLPSGDKFSRLLTALVEIGCLHLFNDGLGTANCKVDLTRVLQEVAL